MSMITEGERAYNAAYYQANKAHIKSQVKAYKDLDRTAVNEKAKVYYHTVRKGQEKERLRQQEKQCMRLYGLTIKQKREMIAAQDNKCLICCREFANFKDAHVDHDHATGIVRGILCNNCNVALGLFDDDISTMLSAVEYLQKSREEYSA